MHGAGWLEVLHREDRAGLLDSWSHTLDDGTGFDGEFRVVQPNGATVHVRATAGPIRGDDDRVSGFVITAQDISERVGAQQRLSESQELFRNTLENVALAAVQLDCPRPRRLLQPAPCRHVRPSGERRRRVRLVRGVRPAGARLDPRGLCAHDAGRARAAP